jgi:hypothetical protein
MSRSFRLAIALVAFAATLSAVQGENAPSPSPSATDAAQMQLMLMQLMESISRLSGGNLDENTKNVVKQLAVLPLEKLYFLKMSDTCEVAGFNCGKFNAEKVRPLIDIELDRRKAVTDAADKQRSFYLSLGSLLVSCCAFELSVFGLFKKKHRAIET